MQGHTEKISVLEEERACLATLLANITSLPDLAQDYEKLEEMRAKLAYQERVFAEKEKKVSSKVTVVFSFKEGVEQGIPNERYPRFKLDWIQSSQRIST